MSSSRAGLPKQVPVEVMDDLEYEGVRQAS